MGKTAIDESELFFPLIGRILLTVINKSIQPHLLRMPMIRGGNDYANCIQTPLLKPAQGIVVPVEIQQIMKSHAKASIIFQQGGKRIRQLTCSQHDN